VPCREQIPLDGSVHNVVASSVNLWCATNSVVNTSVWTDSAVGGTVFPEAYHAATFASLVNRSCSSGAALTLLAVEPLRESPYKSLCWVIGSADCDASCCVECVG
jgi:hypothetical protein